MNSDIRHKYATPKIVIFWVLELCIGCLMQLICFFYLFHSYKRYALIYNKKQQQN